MLKKGLLIASLLVLLIASAVTVTANDYGAFVGQDLHLSGDEVISHKLTTGEHVLVFEQGLSMSIGANRFESDKGVVWLDKTEVSILGRARTQYRATVYLEQNVSMSKAQLNKTTSLNETTLEGGESMLVRFDVSGEVFVTAEKRTAADPHGIELYRTGLSWAERVDSGPNFVVQADALVPELPSSAEPEQKIVTEEGKVVVAGAEKEPGLFQKLIGGTPEPVEPEEIQPKEPKFQYPIVFAPAGPDPLKVDSAPAPEGTDIATIRQRFYVSQKQNEQGKLLELQADSAVVFYAGSKSEKADSQDLLGNANITAIYMSGDVVMAEGQRVIRADEIFYDFGEKKAIAINAVMKNFDSIRGIPIYIRASKLRQLSETKFSARKVTLTTSEFYVPQSSLTASSVIITDLTTVDEQLGRLSNASYDVHLKDVSVKSGKATLFKLSEIRSNLQRPDVPLRSLSMGYGSTNGFSVETRWFLARLLGLQETPGTSSSLNLDYYGKRGVGGGFDIEYDREDHFGNMSLYVLNDHGEDELGRLDSRSNLEPPRNNRARFSWAHRQFLDDGWQLTAGVDYSCDEHFVEQFYRDEFNTTDRDTYIHLKKSQDNWAFSILGKKRINRYEEKLEELPTIEFHLAGESLFDDRFTFYSSTEVSRLRQKIGNDHMLSINEEMFTFMAHRSELDLPMYFKPFKFVPWVAGTLAYDDRSGFTRSLVDGSDTGEFGDDKVYIGEVGIRVSTQMWKVFPDVKSRIWDLDGLRHIIEPSFMAVMFCESDSEVEQRDLFSIGLSQRWQTKRGPEDDKRIVDFMRLDVDAVFVEDDEEATDMGPGPDRLTWAKPFVPARVFSAPAIFNGDLEATLPRFEMFGPRRDYISGDYVWRISDTTAFLSDAYFDMKSGVVNQLNFGFSRLVWPDFSLYVGSRYLRRVEVLEEKGSHVFTFAATYQLDPRYTLVFAQEYDLDYGAGIRSDVSIIRRYHRVFWGLTFSTDESLDSTAIMLSVWPQGLPELAMGQKNLAKITSVPSQPN